MLKSSAFLVLILCVYNTAASTTRPQQRQLQQVNTKLDVTLSGVGTVSGTSSSSASTSSSIQVELLEAAKEVFKTADSAFGDGKSEDEDDGDFCRSAFTAVSNSAVQLVTVETQAVAKSRSCGDVQGNGVVVAEGSATAQSRARDFAVVLRRAAVRARIGITKARAKAVVRAAVSEFAEAFATASSLAIVNGTGNACAESMTNVTVVVEAVVRTVIILVAEVDCEESFTSGNVTSTVDIVTSNVAAGGGVAITETGADVVTSASGEADGTVAEDD